MLNILNVLLMDTKYFFLTENNILEERESKKTGILFFIFCFYVPAV